LYRIRNSKTNNMSKTLWRLEFSENQQCFHQDSYPCRHEANSNGYFTLLENATLQQCQDFIRSIRAHELEYISKNEILFWRDKFITKN
jgi:hypothetical protein